MCWYVSLTSCGDKTRAICAHRRFHTPAHGWVVPVFSPGTLANHHREAKSNRPQPVSHSHVWHIDFNNTCSTRGGGNLCFKLVLGYIYLLTKTVDTIRWTIAAFILERKCSLYIYIFFGMQGSRSESLSFFEEDKSKFIAATPNTKSSTRGLFRLLWWLAIQSGPRVVIRRIRHSHF